MIDVQDVVGRETATWGREVVASPNHEITIYTSPGAPPAHFVTQAQAPFLLRRMGVVTDDGGRLVGWFGTGEMAELQIDISKTFIPALVLTSNRDPR